MVANQLPIQAFTLQGGDAPQMPVVLSPISVQATAANTQQEARLVADTADEEPPPYNSG